MIKEHSLADLLVTAEEALATICRKPNAHRPWVQTLAAAQGVAEEARNAIKKMRAENRRTAREVGR